MGQALQLYLDCIVWTSSISTLAGLLPAVSLIASSIPFTCLIYGIDGEEDRRLLRSNGVVLEEGPPSSADTADRLSQLLYGDLKD